MKIPREAWWVAGIVMVMLLIALVLRAGAGEQGVERSSARTTYGSAPSGLRAFYLALRELGYDARRLRVPFSASTLPREGTLIMVEPPLPVTAREWRALYRWVGAGHTVILAGHWMLPQFELAFPGVNEMFVSAPLTYPAARQPTYLARGVRKLAVRSAWRIEALGEPRAAQDSKRRRRTQPVRLGAEPYPRELVDALRRAAPLFGDPRGTVVAYARIGAGTAILVSGGWSLSNEGIGKADNLVFALNALGPPGAGPAWFDEYHQGYSQNLVWAFIPLPLKAALVQLLLALLVVMYAVSRRFGAIVPLERATRQRSEFLGTMTALLRKGHATRLALRTAHDAAVQRLRVDLGLPADAGPTELAQAVGRVSPQATEKLMAALRQSRGALEGPETLNESRAVALVRQLDEAVRLALRGQ